HSETWPASAPSRPRHLRTGFVFLGRRISALFSLLIAAGAVSMPAQVPGELRGRVFESDGGRPVPGARVEVTGRTERAFSNADGGFSLRGLEPRRYAIRVRMVGY